MTKEIVPTLEGSVETTWSNVERCKSSAIDWDNRYEAWRTSTPFWTNMWRKSVVPVNPLTALHSAMNEERVGLVNNWVVEENDDEQNWWWFQPS